MEERRKRRAEESGERENKRRRANRDEPDDGAQWTKPTDITYERAENPETFHNEFDSQSVRIKAKFFPVEEYGNQAKVSKEEGERAFERFKEVFANRNHEDIPIGNVADLDFRPDGMHGELLIVAPERNRAHYEYQRQVKEDILTGKLSQISVSYEQDPDKTGIDSLYPLEVSVCEEGALDVGNFHRVTFSKTRRTANLDNRRRRCFKRYAFSKDTDIEIVKEDPMATNAPPPDAASKADAPAPPKPDAAPEKTSTMKLEDTEKSKAAEEVRFEYDKETGKPIAKVEEPSEDDLNFMDFFDYSWEDYKELDPGVKADMLKRAGHKLANVRKVADMSHKGIETVKKIEVFANAAKRLEDFAKQENPNVPSFAEDPEKLVTQFCNMFDGHKQAATKRFSKLASDNVSKKLAERSKGAASALADVKERVQNSKSEKKSKRQNDSEDEDSEEDDDPKDKKRKRVDNSKDKAKSKKAKKQQDSDDDGEDDSSEDEDPKGKKRVDNSKGGKKKAKKQEEDDSEDDSEESEDEDDPKDKKRKRVDNSKGGKKAKKQQEEDEDDSDSSEDEGDRKDKKRKRVDNSAAAAKKLAGERKKGPAGLTEDDKRKNFSKNRIRFANKASPGLREKLGPHIDLLPPGFDVMMIMSNELMYNPDSPF